MKRIIFLAAFFLAFSNQAFAQASDYETTAEPWQPSLPAIGTIAVNVVQNWYFKPALSIEYNAPIISGGGNDKNFKNSQRLSGQLREFQNIAIGGHFRIQKYLGFNLNWVQSELDSTTLGSVGYLSRQANFKIDHVNASALIFMPLVPNTFELFAELGAADMNSKINYIQTNGNAVSEKSHQTKALYGLGFQVHFNQTSSIRFSVQKYSGKLALLGSNYTTVRLGYLYAF